MFFCSRYICLWSFPCIWILFANSWWSLWKWSLPSNSENFRRRRWTLLWTLEFPQGWLSVSPHSMYVVFTWWVGLVWGSGGSVHWYFDRIANKAIPKFHVSKHKLPKVPWLNDACKEAIKERDKAKQTLFHNPTAKNVLAFEQLNAKARHFSKNKRKPRGKISVLR